MRLRPLFTAASCLLFAACTGLADPQVDPRDDDDKSEPTKDTSARPEKERPTTNLDGTPRVDPLKPHEGTNDPAPTEPAQPAPPEEPTCATMAETVATCLDASCGQGANHERLRGLMEMNCTEMVDPSMPTPVSVAQNGCDDPPVQRLVVELTSREDPELAAFCAGTSSFSEAECAQGCGLVVTCQQLDAEEGAQCVQACLLLGREQGPMQCLVDATTCDALEACFQAVE